MYVCFLQIYMIKFNIIPFYECWIGGNQFLLNILSLSSICKTNGNFKRNSLFNVNLILGKLFYSKCQIIIKILCNFDVFYFDRELKAFLIHISFNVVGIIYLWARKMNLFLVLTSWFINECLWHNPNKFLFVLASILSMFSL